MADQLFIDVFGDEVVMTETVQATTLDKHPEAALFVHLIDQVLRTPDEVRRSNRDERSVLYYLYRHDVLGGKWIVVVVKQVECKFVSTLYATDKVKTGAVLWTR